MEAIIKKIQKKVNQRYKKEKRDIYDINHDVIDEFLITLTNDETEKILYKYGFNKAIGLYIDTMGSDISNIDSEKRMKCILYIVLMESRIIEE